MDSTFKCFFCYLDKPVNKQVNQCRKLSLKPEHKKLQEKYPTSLDVFFAFSRCCGTHQIDVDRGDPGLICRDCMQLLESFVIIYDELIIVVEGAGHPVVQEELHQQQEGQELFQPINNALTNNMDCIKQEFISEIKMELDETINNDDIETKTTDFIEWDFDQNDEKKKISTNLDNEKNVDFVDCQTEYSSSNNLIKNETPKESVDDETSFIYTKVLYPCENCDYTTHSKHHLKTHVESKHEGTSYPCKQCDYQSLYKTSLQRHIRSVHDGIQYFCDKCDYKTKEKGNLKKHVNNIHVKEEKYYTCEHCDYTTQKPINIKNHTQAQHEGILYFCKQCDYKAKYRSSLNRHVLSIHEGVTYPCKQCDYKSTDKGNLKKHVSSIHEGVTYPCKQCDFKAAEKGYLKKHVFNIHINNKQTKPKKS